MAVSPPEESDSSYGKSIITPVDVRHAEFAKPPIGKRGYDEDEVDAFLDIIEEDLQHYISDIESLRERIAELEFQLKQTKNELEAAYARADDAESRVRDVERKAEQVAKITSASGVADGSEAEHTRASKILLLAQRTADELETDARAESEKVLNKAHATASQQLSEAEASSKSLVNDAQAEAERVVGDAHNRATGIMLDAEARAKQLKEDAERQHNEIMGAINDQRSALEGRISQLKIFEREYRSRLHSYIESQLEALRSQGEINAEQG